MFRLIIRNLAHTLRRYPLPSAINLAGLVVALTAFIIILSHVEFETSYDTSYPTSGRIFRVDCPGNDATHLPATSSTPPPTSRPGRC